MPLSQPHADTMELDNTGPDTSRRVYVCVCVQMEALCGLRAGGCVCMYAVRLMEQDREVDYRGDYNFLVTL